MADNRTGIRNKIIFRGIFSLVLIGFLITACSTSGSAPTSINWSLLLLAIVLIIGLSVGIGYLVKLGKFEQWRSAGVNDAQWKLQEKKLAGQKENAEQERDILIAQLGERAWQSRVYHPSYQESYDALEALEAQLQPLVIETKEVENKLNQIHNSRASMFDAYSKQLNDLVTAKEDAEKKLEKNRSQVSKLEKDQEKLNQDLSKAQAEITIQQENLNAVQVSDMPDKEKQVQVLKKSISALQEKLTKANSRIHENDLEGSNLAIAQQPLGDQIARLEEQIFAVESDQKDALSPLDENITRMEVELGERNAHISKLRGEMAVLIQTMAPLVEFARPESEELTRPYYEVDKIKTKLAEITKEHHLVSAQLDSSDPTMVRNFYLMIAVILLLVVLIVVLLVLAL